MNMRRNRMENYDNCEKKLRRPIYHDYLRNLIGNDKIDDFFTQHCLFNNNDKDLKGVYVITLGIVINILQ